MESMMQAVKEALGNYNFIYLYGICLLIALILMKGRRKIYIVPAAFIFIAVLTPVFYDFWNDINDYAYWRTLWIIPVIPVCASVPAFMVEKLKREWLKPIAVIAGIGVVVLCGSYIYKAPYTTFRRAYNPDKLPSEVYHVANELLKMEEYPSIVADSGLSVYLRQYSGRIYMPYARDVVYGSPSKLGRDIYTEISSENGDMNKVARLMLNYGYDYLVTADASDTKLASLERAGFKLKKTVGGYGIYKVMGKPTEIRTYNDKHLVSSVTTVDASGNLVIGDDGYARVVYEYDKYGHVTYEFHYDEEGDAIGDAQGKAGYRKSYDHLGNVLSETNIGVDGEPIIIGFATRKRKYNKRMLISEAFYDIEDRPMLNTDTAYSVRTISYNRDKAITGERYYNTKGQLTISKSGYAGYDREIDRNAGKAVDRYIGSDSRYMVIAEGYAAVKRDCDEDGNVITDYYIDESGLGTDEIYLDLDGKETLNRLGYSRIHREYNDQGKAVSYDYYAYEEPFTMLYGYTGIKREYDEYGNIISESYHDSDDSLVSSTSGYALCNRGYNDDNLLVRESYYDEKDESAVINSGYDEVLREYNKQRQLLKESYYAAGKPVLRIDRWFASYMREYDERGNMIAESYYDNQGSPASCDKGYAVIKREYNELRQPVKEYYQDEAGNNVICSDGYAGIERIYDERGNVIEETYIGTDGKPTLLNSGYACVRRQYNEINQLIREEYYDADGVSAVITSGYSAVEREYDKCNNVTIVRYLDQNGDLINCTGGYAVLKREYNDRSQAEKEYYYDTDMNPVAIGDEYYGILREYSYAGDVTSEKYIDNNDAPVLVGAGYAAVVKEYDATRRLIRETFNDVDGNICAVNSGYAVKVRDFEGVRLIKESFLDADDKPVNRDNTYAVIRYEYLPDNQLSLTRYYDADGNELDMGSSYMHSYLSSLKDKDVTIFLSVKDDGTYGLTATLLDDLSALGIRENLKGKVRASYYAVINGNSITEELGMGKLTHSGKVGTDSYTITSAGYYSGNQSSILINGQEYSKNVRGMNIVIYDNRAGEVIESIGIDTYTNDMTVTW